MISVCILTKNSEATLRETLESTRAFPDVVIYDNGSTDGTLEMARSFPNVQVQTGPFIGFGPLRNVAAGWAKHDWILALDSDEVLSPPLIEELQRAQPEKGYIYRISRHNFHNHKRIKGCGWENDWVVRLYNRLETGYSESEVHEAVLKKELRVVSLRRPIYHTPFRSTEEFLSKMQHYSTLFAKQHEGKRRSSFPRALASGLFAFLRSYVFQKGFLLGQEGFAISLYNGNTAFYKYIKLAERNKDKREV
jgi:glycosyltransferase involved in cell wall biosynthesis